MMDIEKEPSMNKTYWYGANGGVVRFADNQAALTSEGIDNAQSFTVNGEITGLNLIGQTDQPVGSSQQTA
jgi:hypothetical protein